MKAAIVTAQGAPVEVANDIDIDRPNVGQVSVEVSHCGVCHSDLSIADGAFPAPLPIILGHEATGVVQAVGAGVTGLEPGDPVVLTPCPPCGTCYWCVRHEPSVCIDAQGIYTNTFADGSTGLSRRGEVVYRGVNMAAFAEHVLVPARGAVKVDADVALDIACVIGCAVQTGVGAVFNIAAVTPGATVLVCGLGGIGLSAVQGARIAGATRIIASDPVAERREAASRLGATDLLDPTSDNMVAAVQELTGVGVDYAFETAGKAALVAGCLDACRMGGTTVCVGAPAVEENIELVPAAAFTVSGKKLLGCLLGGVNSLHEIPRLIRLWKAGHLDLEALVTARRPLDEINNAMDDLRAGKGVRTVLDI